MKKQEIIKDLDERIKASIQIIDAVKNGQQNIYFKTQKAKQLAIKYQEGFVWGLELAKDYLENYLDKREEDVKN